MEAGALSETQRHGNASAQLEAGVARQARVEAGVEARLETRMEAEGLRPGVETQGLGPGLEAQRLSPSVEAGAQARWILAIMEAGVVVAAGARVETQGVNALVEAGIKIR